MDCTLMEKIKKADCVYHGGGIKPTLDGFPSNLLAKATAIDVSILRCDII